ncbi:two-component system, sensor histidine kinase YesM [Paenibacillus sp. UNCCL117]|uniref:cache domain-containing sensor histidine kinase n=1 Tax=unclassified Paenibacillus TaxID=185978 RepID=UPI000882C863|nr:MULTISPECIES: sensor histidine kinase [unclassified Paenibacillus]SDE56276.1 two-component system, sensor histidine kinase YesM [Paenibacillus sp. cl123]SFW66217.1 two-component system, sensor histidine kinase YesM [Paenibacillus sp. UNCCL117]
MRFFRNSIRYKLVALLLISTILPIVLSIVISYMYTKDSLKQQAIEQNTRLITEAGMNILNYLGTVVNSSLSVYSNASIDSLLTGGVDDYQNDSYILTIMQIVSRSAGDIYQVYLGLEGANRAYLLHQNNFNRGPILYKPPIPTTMSPYTLYTEPTHPSHDYGVVRSPLALIPEKVFTVHRPIFRVPSNEQIGLLSIDIKQEALSKLTAQLYDADNKDIYILDDAGVVVYGANSGEGEGEGEEDPRAEWMTRVLDSGRDAGYLEWSQSDFSGIMVYSKLTNAYLNWTIVKRIPDSHLYKYARRLTLINSAVASICLLIATAAILIVSLRLTKPLKQLISHISKIQAGQLDATIPIERSDEIGIVAKRFQNMMDTINDLFLREYKLNLANKTNQLKMLQAQINPHFINNALQSIGHSALENQAPKVYTLITSLGQMMHYSMNTQETVVPLSREIEHVHYYCELQLERFGERLQVAVDIDRAAASIHVPKMLVQPIVENYFKHGFDGQPEGVGILRITARVDEKRLIIRVEDNGKGMPEDGLRKLQQRLTNPDPSGEKLGESIGLVNVLYRLRLYYGEAGGMTLRAVAPQGLRVKLSIPLNVTMEEELT